MCLKCAQSSFPAVGVGTRSFERSHRRHGASQLPGQRSCRLHLWPEEVHRVLHVGVVLHHPGGWPTQPASAASHPRGQWVLPVQDIIYFIVQADNYVSGCCSPVYYLFFMILFTAPGAVGHLSFTDILDTSLKVSWKEPQEKNGVLTGKRATLTRLWVTAVCFSLPHTLESATSSRLSYLLGGVQQDQYPGDPLPAQLNSGVQSDGAHRAHHLHHPGGSHDRQGPGTALRLHHLLRCAARSEEIFHFKLT